MPTDECGTIPFIVVDIFSSDLYGDGSTDGAGGTTSHMRCTLGSTSGAVLLAANANQPEVISKNSNHCSGG